MERINSNKFKKTPHYNKVDSIYYKYFTFIHQIFLKIIGLSPWTVDSSGIYKNHQLKNHNFECYFSRAGSCYNVLLFITCICFDIFIVLNISSIKIDSRPILDAVAVKLSFVATLCISLIPLIYIFQQKLIISVNRRFKTVDQKLNKCADFKMANDNTNYFIFTTNLAITSCLIIMREIYYMSVEIVFAISIPYFISSWVIIQFAMLINMLKKRFESINLTISKLGTIESKIPLSRYSVLNDISSIKYAYVELCEMCDDATDFYGLPLLIVIVMFAIRTLLNLYYIIIALIDKQKIDTGSYLSGLFILGSIFLFIILTTAVTQLIKQVSDVII